MASSSTARVEDFPDPAGPVTSTIPSRSFVISAKDWGRRSVAKSGKTDDAVKAYNQAAQSDPAGAATYYFNEGAIMTNTGKVDDAIAAFDKAIAADPAKADAYYWKGVNLMGKATLKGDKMVAPDGTAEAFNKYLELQPTGQFADPAKQMLASIGASVQTSFGNKKKASKK